MYDRSWVFQVFISFFFSVSPFSQIIYTLSCIYPPSLSLCALRSDTFSTLTSPSPLPMRRTRGTAPAWSFLLPILQKCRKTIPQTSEFCPHPILTIPCLRSCQRCRTEWNHERYEPQFSTNGCWTVTRRNLVGWRFLAGFIEKRLASLPNSINVRVQVGTRGGRWPQSPKSPSVEARSRPCPNFPDLQKPLRVLPSLALGRPSLPHSQYLKGSWSWQLTTYYK